MSSIFKTLPSWTMLSLFGSIGIVLATIPAVQAHKHHHDGPADNSIPIDSILWIHIGIQAFAWFFLFPLAMVLGLVRHRLHVPLATTSLALTVGGYFLGHGHGGRSFPHTAHGTMASLLVFYLGAQTFLGVYLKLHLQWRPEKWIRPTLVAVHGLLGKSFPIAGWVQMVFGITTLQSWCFGGHLDQCFGHYIIGSTFQAYAAILIIMMKAGGDWLQRRGKSQEWFDSWVIVLSGVANLLAGHRGGHWTQEGLRQSLMGVLWLISGAGGIWLSRGGRRNILPSAVLILTGWAMSAQAKELKISTQANSFFGYALVGAGIARLIEVCFVLQDRPTGSTRESPDAAVREDDTQDSSRYPIRAFQYLPPFLLVASGVLYMSATDEEMKWADSQGVDAATWGLLDLSLSMLVFLWVNVLVDLYLGYGGRYGAAQKNAAQVRRADGEAQPTGSLYSRLSLGQIGAADLARSNMQERAEHHELGGMSGKRGLDGDDDEFTEPNHVLFGEEDEDPFEEKEEEDGGSSGSGSAVRNRGEIHL